MNINFLLSFISSLPLSLSWAVGENGDGGCCKEEIYPFFHAFHFLSANENSVIVDFLLLLHFAFGKVSLSSFCCCFKTEDKLVQHCKLTKLMFIT